jgi:hypothetical protein
MRGVFQRCSYHRSNARTDKKIVCTGSIPRYDEVLPVQIARTITVGSSTSGQICNMVPQGFAFFCTQNMPGGFMQIDFNGPQELCGIQTYAMKVPNAPTFFSIQQFEVMVSDDNTRFTSLGTFRPDMTQSLLPSKFRFSYSIVTRHMRFIVVAVDPKISTTVYMNVSFMQNCDVCPEGQIGCSNTKTRSSSCIIGSRIPFYGLCDSGTAMKNGICQPCAAGQYGALSRRWDIYQCFDCPPGTYNTLQGVHGLQGCISCVAGTYTTVTAPAQSKNHCIRCPPGTWSSIPNAIGPEHCVACIRGKFSGVAGASSVETCQDCAPKTWHNKLAQSSQADCRECGC